MVKTNSLGIMCWIKEALSLMRTQGAGRIHRHKFSRFIKHKAIEATGYGAGLRIAEVAALQKTDIEGSSKGQ